MNSSYQMWLTHNGEAEKIRFPVLPEKITIKMEGNEDSLDISGLGEIFIMQDRPAVTISFSGFFPSQPFPGIEVEDITAPATLVQRIWDWKNSGKPSHFLIPGTGINMFCIISTFPCEEQGGDVGTVYYSLTLKEYREVAVRQIDLNEGKASLPVETPVRTDNRVQPKTYTVKKGDCLWNIAKAQLGNGSRYKEIYELNRDKIKNPNLIYSGQVLKLPDA